MDLMVFIVIWCSSVKVKWIYDQLVFFCDLWFILVLIFDVYLQLVYVYTWLPSWLFNFWSRLMVASSSIQSLVFNFWYLISGFQSLASNLSQFSISGLQVVFCWFFHRSAPVDLLYSSLSFKYYRCSNLYYCVLFI